MFSHLGLDNYAIGMPVIALVVIVSVLGQVFVRRFLIKEKIESCHEVGGVILGIMGTLYAVILGLVVLDAMTKFETTESLIVNESQSLMLVVSIAEQFKTEREVIRQLSKDYIDEVVTNDWEFLGKGIRGHHKAGFILKKILNEVKKIEPITENEKGLFPVLLQEVVSICKYRVARIDQSLYGIPIMKWIMLIVGGVMTIIFTYFFTIENQKLQSLMTGMYTLMIAMNLYMVLMFTQPYSGDFQASKRSLLLAQEQIQEELSKSVKNEKQ